MGRVSRPSISRMLSPPSYPPATYTPRNPNPYLRSVRSKFPLFTKWNVVCCVHRRHSTFSGAADKAETQVAAITRVNAVAERLPPPGLDAMVTYLRKNSSWHPAARTHTKHAQPVRKAATRGKRRLLDFVVSNSVWREGKIVPVRRQPFDAIALAK